MQHTTEQDAYMQKTRERLSVQPWLPGILIDFALTVSRVQWETERRLQLQPSLSIPHTNITPKDKFLQGQPLLTPQDFPYEKTAVHEVWNTLQKICADMPEGIGVASKKLYALCDKGDDVSPDMAFAAYIAGDMDFFTYCGNMLPEAPALVHFLAQASLTPWLYVASEQLHQQHPSPEVWEFGHCPHCGQDPFIGQLRDKEGRRWHICSFCRISYRVPRVQCPYCLEKDGEKLRFFTTDTHADYATHVCETCKNYIKIHNARESISAIPPSAMLYALDDLGTLHLDIMARQHGYTRTTFCTWSF